MSTIGTRVVKVGFAALAGALLWSAQASAQTPVTNGGTGRTSLNQGGVLVGNGTNPINSVAGNAGNVLMSGGTTSTTRRGHLHTGENRRVPGVRQHLAGPVHALAAADAPFSPVVMSVFNVTGGTNVRAIDAITPTDPYEGQSAPHRSLQYQLGGCAVLSMTSAVRYRPRRDPGDGDRAQRPVAARRQPLAVDDDPPTDVNVRG